MSNYGFGTCEGCGTTCSKVWHIDGMVRCATCAILHLAPLPTDDRPEYRTEDYESESEREEREASIILPEVPSDEDWAAYMEDTYSDPYEGPCCADPMCPCGGYVGNYHGPKA